MQMTDIDVLVGEASAGSSALVKSSFNLSDDEDH